MQRHRLVDIAEIAIVAIGAHRHARDYRGIQLRRVEAPLFSGVISKEFFVQFAPHPVDHHIFRIHDRRSRLGHGSKKAVHLERCEIQAVEPVDRVQVDGYRQMHPVHARANAVLVRPPFREPREVLEHFLAVRMKNVGAVLVDQDAVLIIMVVRIPADMRALIA